MKRLMGCAALLVCVAGCPPMGGSGNGDGGSRNWFTPQKSKGGEQLQIECGRYQGMDRMRVADELGASLKAVPGVSPQRVRVVHEENYSVITYGPYPLRYTAGGGIQVTEEVRRDLNVIRSLSIGEEHPFLTAAVRPIPTADVGPPEWDLRRAPGVYTLQIGVFYNTDTFHERKEAAVEWVKDLRSRGFPAFYCHDNVKRLSAVTVGAFDESAAKGTVTEIRDPRHKDFEADLKRDYSPEVIALRENSEFKYNYVNAAIEKVNRNPQPSFLVRIPRGSTAKRPDDMELIP